MKSNPFLITLIVLIVSTQIVKSQVKTNFCQTLQSIIKEAENGTFINIRGEKKKNNDFGYEYYISKISFNSRANLWWHENDGWSFSEFPSYEKEHFTAYYNTIKNCLPTPDWVACNESDRGNIKWVFKNLKTRIFVSITNILGVEIKVFQHKNTTAKCLWGDCQNGYGSYKHENDDVYTGDFINGYRNGVGVYTWAASGEYYDGYWLNGKRNGRGSIYKSDSTLLSKGIMYEGQWIDVDMNKTKNFTKGDRINGFGMIYNDGKYEIGTYKDGKPSGFFLADKSNTSFGHYQDGFTGFCIVYYPDGSSYYGNFENGVIKGKGTFYNTDGTKSEGLFDKNLIKGSKFDSYDFLIQKLTLQDGKLTVDNSSGTQSQVKFARSLSYIAAQGAIKLKDKEIEDEFAIYTGYTSKYKLVDAVKTEITTDMKTLKYVIESKMNASKLNKTQALAQYNSLVEKVRNCISSSWKGEETENKDNNDNVFRVYKFSNSMFYYSFEIKCWFNNLYISVL